MPIRRMLLVDLSHRFWSTALGGSRDGTPETTAARDLVLREIRSMAGGYDRVVIACDGPGRSWRSKLWPAYKAKRRERPESLWTLLADTARRCEAAGYHVLHAPAYIGPDNETTDTYYEADDVIGSVVGWARENSIAADILSGDSDVGQLVDDAFSIRLIRAYKGYHPMNEEGVTSWLGVSPSRVIDLKALAGDPGDGYGDLFPGVGEKTAKKMIAAAGGCREAVQQTIDAGKKGTIADTIRTLGMDRLEIGILLARVCQDVPLPLETIRDLKQPTTLPEVTADLVPPDDAIEGEPVEPKPSAQSAPVQTSTALIVDQSSRMLTSPAEARERLTELRAMVRAVLTPDVDYGLIPGCGDKPALKKSGAEKLAEAYGLSVSFEVQTSTENWDPDSPFFFYRIKCLLRRRSDGRKLADCIGSCNSRETKYAGRWAWERDVPAHLDRARLRKRQVVNKHPRPGEGDLIDQFSVPNERIYDEVNTILKMAEKRALVGAVLIATRASAIFAADIDDNGIPASAYGTVNDQAQWEQTH